VTLDALLGRAAFASALLMAAASAEEVDLRSMTVTAPSVGARIEPPTI